MDTKTKIEEVDESLKSLNNAIDKILRQKYSLCEAVKIAIQTLEERIDNGENDQWMHSLIVELEMSLKQARS